MPSSSRLPRCTLLEFLLAVLQNVVGTNLLTVCFRLLGRLLRHLLTAFLRPAVLVQPRNLPFLSFVELDPLLPVLLIEVLALFVP